MRSLNDIDLNLLKTFDALMRAKSVTKAAEQMGIGQPAMSSHLARLRDLFDDELLVRSSNIMVSTPRAEVLAEKVRLLLEQISRDVLSDTDFSPANSEQTFRIAMSDYMELMLLGPLTRHLVESAPGMKLDIVPLELRQRSELLDDKGVDFVIGGLQLPEKWHRSIPLFTSGTSCVYSKTQIPLDPPIGIDDYLSHNHVLRSLIGGQVSIVDEILKESGRFRNIVLAAPSVSTLPAILSQSPVIATVPNPLSLHLTQYSDLVVSPLPLDIPAFSILMLWHVRNDTSPAHLWMKNLIEQTAKNVQQ